jgi:hypothetical protein
MLPGGKSSDGEIAFLQAGDIISAPPVLTVNLLDRH